MSEHDPNRALMEAVSAFDLEGVERSLANGADPNHLVEPDGAEGPVQPTTPLRMVVFRISDNFLEEDDLRAFAKIAALLLASGADPTDALRMAESRYGPYPEAPEPGAFVEVWRTLVEAGRDDPQGKAPSST